MVPATSDRSILSNTHTPPTRNIRGVSKPCLGGVVAKVKHKHLETWMRVSDATIHYDPDDAGVSMPLCQQTSIMHDAIRNVNVVPSTLCLSIRRSVRFFPSAKEFEAVQIRPRLANVQSRQRPE